jgi:hypothetical protein
MSIVIWVSLGVTTASIVFGLISALGANRLMSDMYRAPDKTVWELLVFFIAHTALPHHEPKPQTKHDEG